MLLNKNYKEKHFLSNSLCFKYPVQILEKKKYFSRTGDIFFQVKKLKMRKEKKQEKINYKKKKAMGFLVHFECLSLLINRWNFLTSPSLQVLTHIVPGFRILRFQENSQQCPYVSAHFHSLACEMGIVSLTSQGCRESLI